MVKTKERKKSPLMLIISDKKFFCEIVADSVAQAHLTFRRRKAMRDRWINAIAKAATRILEGDTTFLHWDPHSNTLYYWSPESNEIYQSSGETCGCPAFLQPDPKPCYHRAMSWLVKNYFEFRQKPGEIARIDFADAVFFDPELSAREKVELLNMSILEGRVELVPRARALQKYSRDAPEKKTGTKNGRKITAPARRKTGIPARKI